MTADHNAPRADIYEEIVRLRALGQKCALATIVDVEGSIPSYESAKLLVREDGSKIGTIGGGCVEGDVWNAARAVMELERPKRLSFNLSRDASYDNGLICGGQLEVFVEPILPAPRLILFGAGHISLALARVASISGFNVTIADDRADYANAARFPMANEVYAGAYEDTFSRLAINSSSYLVIVTRGHRDDMRVLKLASSTQARYVAMVGSKRKVLNVAKTLEAEGVSRDALERIHAPMGLSIGAVSPEEIAISVMAEIIAVRRNATSDWRVLSMSVFAAQRTPEPVR